MLNRRIVGAAVALVALGVLLATMMPGPALGESADYVAGFAGLDPFPPLSHFLWGYVIRILNVLPGPSLAWWGNLFSVLCGAAVVYLVFYLVTEIPHRCTREETEATFDPGKAALLSGLVAAGLTLTAIPFWIVATRAHPATFDLLWLLGMATWLLLIARGGRSARWLYLWVAVYAAGVTEYATMIIAAPVFAVVVLGLMWKQGWLRLRVVAVCLVCFIVPLFLYGLYAWEYMRTGAFSWRGFSNYWWSLWFVWRDQYRAIAKSVPQVGWLLLFTTVLVPAIAIFYPKARCREGRIAYSIFLHLVLSAVALLVFLNARLAPWRLFRWRPLLVAPYLLCAVWAGYLAGYWWIVLGHPAGWKFRQSERLQRLWRLIYPLGLIGLVLVIGWRNLPEVVNPADRAVSWLGREISRRLRPGDWLITSGVMDNLVRLEAAERQIPIQVVSVPAYASRSYGRYVSSLFTNERLRVLAQIGLEPLLERWLDLEPGAAEHVVTVDNPDLLVALEVTPRPECCLYRGIRAAEGERWQELLHEHRRFWDTALPSAKRCGQESPLGQWYRRVLSKEANNFGVYLEDVGRPEEAAEAYRTARAFDTNNISALLNLFALKERVELADADQIQKEFELFLANLSARLRIWSLSYYYGYVRYPEAFADRGMAWALSGKARRAISDLERAMQLGAGSTVVQLALAQLYFQEEQLPASRDYYLKVLEQDPGNLAALLGLARIAMRQGDFDSARSYLERLEELGMAPGVVLMEKVALESLLGNKAGCKELLEKIVKLQPRNARAWAALAIIAQSEGDTDTVERCLAKLSEMNAAQYPSVRRVIGQVAAAEGRLDVARRHLEEVLRVRPFDREALEFLLQLDLRQRLRSAAEKHALQLLRVDPENYLGNMVLGGQYYLRGEYALAESCFRTAVEKRRTDWALNELAWTLHRLGRDKEALPLVQEALQVNSDNVMAWDTLGSVLMELGRLEEADSALRKCIQMRPDDPVVLLHIAQLRAAQGRSAEALKMAESLLLRGNEMPAELYQEARDLARRLRRLSAG